VILVGDFDPTGECKCFPLRDPWLHWAETGVSSFPITSLPHVIHRYLGSGTGTGSGGVAMLPSLEGSSLVPMG
jgi:hypothetical protein